MVLLYWEERELEGVQYNPDHSRIGMRSLSSLQMDFFWAGLKFTTVNNILGSSSSKLRHKINIMKQ